MQITSFNSFCQLISPAPADPLQGSPHKCQGTNCKTIDTVVACCIDLADFPTASSAALVDVCSYPSQQPNSDPSDCVVHTTGQSPCSDAATRCNDGNPCTIDTCNADTGACINTPGNSGTVCRASAGACDPAEVCDGVSSVCPTDAKSTAECRASAGACDPAEFCDGVSNACPADAKSTAVCRAAAGDCDVAESCNGVSNDCPTDAFKSSSVECRAAAGVCDVAEHCTGSSATCPADAKSTAVCRAAAGVCDVAESCDGVSNHCPTDAFKLSSVECRAAAGVCDVAENCTGSSAACPADAKSTAVCRAAAGVCDVAESCDGVNNDCPANAFQPLGTQCSADENACLTSQCNGSGSCVTAEEIVITGPGTPCAADGDCPTDGACAPSATISGCICAATPNGGVCVAKKAQP